MKKLLSLICAAALIALSGCQGTQQPQNTAGSTENNADTAQTEISASEEKSEVPEDMEYKIENGITERMKALSAYIKGNRARLARVFQKAQSGGKITVAYIGGSITQGSSAGDELCYARLTTNWLEEQFPSAKIEYVRAGIGATGSYIGVHRLDRDVISASPDLVFVEFSVNDTTEKTERNRNSYDSLIRKLWFSDTSPAVVAIAMTMEDGTSFQQYHSEICRAYDIPMISYREAILDVIENGHIAWKDISDDNIHPNVTGHAVLTEIVTAFLKDVIDDLDNIDASAESDLSEPFTDDKYANADMLTPQNTEPISSEGWKTTGTNFGNFGGTWRVRSDDGSFDGVRPLKFEVNAKNIGIFYGKLTKSGGTFDVAVDSRVLKTINSDFKGGWGNYVEAEEIISLGEAGSHIVEIIPRKADGASTVQISAIAVS